MKTISIAFALTLAESTLSLPAQDDAGGPPPPPDGPPPAQSGPPGGPGGEHRRPPSPLVMVLDANHDGVIDADEIANASEALKKLDKNGDGKLTPDEYRPPHPPRREGRGPEQSGTASQPADAAPGGKAAGEGVNGAHQRPVPPLERVLDANGDGVIDADEIANAPAALKQLDKNGDGKLTPDEYRPPRPPRPDGQGGPGGQPPDANGAGQGEPQPGGTGRNPGSTLRGNN